MDANIEKVEKQETKQEEEEEQKQGTKKGTLFFRFVLEKITEMNRINILRIHANNFWECVQLDHVHIVCVQILETIYGISVLAFQITTTGYRSY